VEEVGFVTELMEGGSGGFEELFGVIARYSEGDYDHQVKALQTLAATYSPLFETPAMPDARAVVEGILERHDYLVETPGRGGLEPASVDAVVSVATSRLDDAEMKWGANLLLHVMEALGRRAREEGYETYVLDARVVLDAMDALLAVDIAEDMITDSQEISEGIPDAEPPER
jgi:hypothetical protein